MNISIIKLANSDPDYPDNKRRIILKLKRAKKQALRLAVVLILIISFYPKQTIAQFQESTGTSGVTTLHITTELPLLLPKTTYRTVWLTAYTSSPEETDDTPFITASGKSTGDGIAAANFLPFGTKFRVPEIFGGKVFTVEDRMAARKVGFVDIWVSTKETAYKIGIRQTKIEILK